MPQTAAGDEYSSSVRRLRLHVEELSDLCEERLGLQRVAKDDPYRLSCLLNAVAEGLSEVRIKVVDHLIRSAARERQLKFDEIADAIFQHVSHDYSDPTQAFEAWGRHRRRLREELDKLGTWVSGLLIATYVILAGLSYGDMECDADIENDRRAG